MSISSSKGTGRLSANALADFLARPSLLCFVGPEFSQECGAPHFRDIQRGVWSKGDGRLNVFSSPKGRATVLEWFIWRMHLVLQTLPSSAYQTLARFQQLRNLQVVSQNIDGLAQLNGVARISEPCGNIFGWICSACDASGAAPTPEAAIIALREPCPHCSAAVLPDVSMFGRNQKTERCLEIAEHLHSSRACLAIGASTNLPPLQGKAADAFFASTRLVVQRAELQLQDARLTRSASLNELAEDFKNTTGHSLPVSDQKSLASSLDFLLKLSEAGTHPA